LALEVVSRLTKEILIVQSLTMPEGERKPLPADLTIDERSELLRDDWPKLAFIEQRLQGDPTNWWVPSERCLEAMLRSSGMRIEASPGHEIYLCTPEAAPDSDERPKNDEYEAALGLHPARG
jgi:tRNA (mo5U34)-methyltransferase